MDVDDAVAPARDEVVRQQPHVAGKRDDLASRLAQGGVDLCLIGRLADPLGRQREGLEPPLARPGEARGIGLVGCDEADRHARFDQRHHVRAAARDQDADGLHRPVSHGCGWRSSRRARSTFRCCRARCSRAGRRRCGRSCGRFRRPQ
ncbi:hypothetical protein WR25_17920 [Diploscapter pachys]|uniref:Uncharacterized protein n=1 Tax=Diploscapter pachys TaxID=2018661 RepID=A0A2A2M555_9BILA|nr:hypothetical protein WR25_17920 [Diploscapter pachys]